jgi:hypothetical protein
MPRKGDNLRSISVSRGAYQRFTAAAAARGITLRQLVELAVETDIGPAEPLPPRKQRSDAGQPRRSGSGSR